MKHAVNNMYLYMSATVYIYTATIYTHSVYIFCKRIFSQRPSLCYRIEEDTATRATSILHDGCLSVALWFNLNKPFPKDQIHILYPRIYVGIICLINERHKEHIYSLYIRKHIWNSVSVEIKHFHRVIYMYIT